MYIIPAIDLIEGKCVRLTKGDYGQKKVYNENPLEVAKEFEGAGLGRLHLVDLDGAKAKKVINWKVLEKLASKTSLHIDFGGGIQSDEDLKIAFEAGARQVTGGSISAKSPERFSSWLSKYGPEKIILGADSKDEKIMVSGWEEGTSLDVYEFVSAFVSKGAQYVIATDINKDGMLEGPAFRLYEKLQESAPSAKVIASGGVSTLADLEKLSEKNLFAAIVGKAIYEGRVTLSDLSKINKPPLEIA